MLRSALLKKGRMSHGGRSSSGAPTYHANVMTPVPVTASSNVYNQLIGGLVLSTATDFTELSTLFDTVRVKGIVVKYRPIAAGVAPPNAGSVGFHVPMTAIFDPQTPSAIPFGTAVNSRDWMDEKSNIFRDTSLAWDHHFVMPYGKTVFTTNAPNSSLSNWNDINQVASCDGGVSISIESIANGGTGLNSATQFGYIIACYLCEWTYRI